jgi:two-component sensor histidine kinase
VSPALSPEGRWTERFPLWRLGLAADLALALAVTAAAAGLRFLLDGSLPGLPFITFFPAVILVAFVAGSRAGTLTAVFSGLTAWYWFLHPVDSFALDLGGAMALALFVLVTATQIVLVHWMQRSNSLLVAEREANGRLAETRELLFRELQHRVSNNLQMVAAMLTIQRRQVSDDGAKAALDEAARRLQTIGKISREIYNPASVSKPLGTFLDQLARDVIETSSTSPVSHRVTGDNGARISPESAIPLALVVAESIANAIEHGFTDDQQDRRLEIRLSEQSSSSLAVEIEDNGRGLADGFSLAAPGNSLGLRIANMLAAQLGGTFTLSPGAGGGALARLELPLEPA